MDHLFEYLTFENSFDRNIVVTIEVPIGGELHEYEIDPLEVRRVNIDKNNVQSIKIFAKWANDPDHKARLSIDLRSGINYPQYYLTGLTTKFNIIGSLHGEINIEF